MYTLEHGKSDTYHTPEFSNNPNPTILYISKTSYKKQWQQTGWSKGSLRLSSIVCYISRSNYYLLQRKSSKRRIYTLRPNIR